MHARPRLMGSVTPFRWRAAAPSQIGFERQELTRILDLYGRMVAAGHWRDYAMDFERDLAVFSAFRRAAERPEIRIEKRPDPAQPPGHVGAGRRAGAVLNAGTNSARCSRPSNGG